MMGLLVSYLLLPLQDMKFEPTTHITMGSLISYTLFVSGSLNGLTVFAVSLADFHGKAKLFYRRKCGKKNKNTVKLHITTLQQLEDDEPLPSGK